MEVGNTMEQRVVGLEGRMDRVEKAQEKFETSSNNLWEGHRSLKEQVEEVKRTQLELQLKMGDIKEGITNMRTELAANATRTQTLVEEGNRNQLFMQETLTSVLTQTAAQEALETQTRGQMWNSVIQGFFTWLGAISASGGIIYLIVQQFFIK